MKFVALVSGGKDSYHAIQQAMAVGHELVVCLHMAAKPRRPHQRKDDKDKDTSNDEEDEESYMYQSAGSEVVRQQVQDCLQVPYLEYTRRGTSQQTSLVYQFDNDANQEADHHVPPPLPSAQSSHGHDEVEDLYHALRLVLQHYPQVTAVCCGAILSTYQRVRVEYVACHALHLHSLAYLWRAGSQAQVLEAMLESGLDAVVVRTAAPPGLLPRRHLGQPLSHLQSYIQHTLYPRYHFHVCGEGGEYETLCTASPLFGGGGAHRQQHQEQRQRHERRLVLDRVQVDYDDPTDETVANLRILASHVQEVVVVEEPTKEGDDDTDDDNDKHNDTDHGEAPIPQATTTTSSTKPQDNRDPTTALSATTTTPSSSVVPPTTATLPVLSSPTQYYSCWPTISHGCGGGGLWHVGEIACPLPPGHGPIHHDDNDDDEWEAACSVEEARHVLALLQQVLEHEYDCTTQDVVMVHLYLSQMSHFARINQYYQSCFGRFLPPSRSCIAPASPNDDKNKNNRPRVVLDCLVQRGSGHAMRHVGTSSTTTTTTTPSPPQRSVLHVQSRSFWAPVCVGPYSQANTLYHALHYLAGQIGLDPPTMTLVQQHPNRPSHNHHNKTTTTMPLLHTPTATPWMFQLQQTWTNLAQVLDALDQGHLNRNTLSCLIYVQHDKVAPCPNQPSTTQNQPHNNSNSRNSNRSDWLFHLQTICQSSLEENGGVIPGLIDFGERVLQDHDDNQDDYEDEETRLAEMAGTTTTATFQRTPFPPLLIVSVPELPVGAEIEVELVAATQPAVTSLGRTLHAPIGTIHPISPCRSTTPSNPTAVWQWDTGQPGWEDYPSALLSSTNNNDNDDDRWTIESHLCTLGRGCAGYAIVTACKPTTPSITTTLSPSNASSLTFSTPTTHMTILANLEHVLDKMMQTLEQSLGPDLTWKELLHLRIYYLASANAVLDRLRTALAMAWTMRQASLPRHDNNTLAAKMPPPQLPATTWVPVYSMHLLHLFDANATDNQKSTQNKDEEEQDMFLAIQATFIEPTNLETELWIRSPR